MKKKLATLAVLVLFATGNGAALGFDDVMYQIDTKLLGQEVYDSGDFTGTVDSRQTSVSKSGLVQFATVQDDTIYPGDEATVCEEFIYESDTDGYIYDSFYLEGDFAEGPTATDTVTRRIKIDEWDEVCIDFEAPSETGSYWIRVDSFNERRGYDADYTVEEEPPEPATADISADRTSIEPGQTVNFDAGGSDGEFPLSYEWYIEEEGPTVGTGESISHTFTEEGTWTMVVIVETSEGDEDTAATTIDVQAENPEAAFTMSTDNVTLGRSVQLNAGQSVPGTYSIDSYQWEVGNESYSGQSTSVTPTSKGWKTVSLTVEDREGNTDSISKDLYVYKPEEPPTLWEKIVGFFRNLF